MEYYIHRIRLYIVVGDQLHELTGLVKDENR